VVYVFRRAGETITCETRLQVDGHGYEIVTTRDGTTSVEAFNRLPDVLAREHELLQAWRAQGWRDADQLTPLPRRRPDGFLRPRGGNKPPAE